MFTNFWSLFYCDPDRVAAAAEAGGIRAKSCVRQVQQKVVMGIRASEAAGAERSP
jgi:hypothetical protein